MHEEGEVQSSTDSVDGYVPHHAYMSRVQCTSNPPDRHRYFLGIKRFGTVTVTHLPRVILPVEIHFLQELRQEERQELDQWPEIDCETEVVDEGHLGTGGFGTVRLARWHDTLVAVKHITRISPKRDMVHDLRREVKVHYGLRFDFIVHLYGASTVRPNLCLVMERAPGG